MAVSPIGQSAVPMANPSLAVPASNGDGHAFNRVIEEFLYDVNLQQLKADQASEHLMTGQTDNIHETMIALSKADLSFRMFMEVRNRAIDAYQEIMRMQI